MSERIMVVPDDGEGREIKLNFKSLWSFFSSLDYLRFLELEGAFRTIDSKNLYYVEEKMEIMTFVLRHVVLWVNVAYWIIVVAGYFLFMDKFLLFHLGFALVYLFGGIWVVHRYTIGRGYLYQLTRDFLMWTTVFVFLSWIISEFIALWLVPRLWKLFELWLFDPASQVGAINSILYPAALNAYWMIKPHIHDVFGMKNFLLWYFVLAPVKVFSLSFPYIYFLLYSRVQGDPDRSLNAFLRKKA